MSFNSSLRKTRELDSTGVIAKWIPRVGLPLAILAWTGVAILVLWLAGQVVHTLLLLTFAAILAYALAPAVRFLERAMPRFAAILVVYLVVLGVLGALLFLVVSVAVEQTISLSGYVRHLLTPGQGGQITPFEQGLRSLGISADQLAAARDQVVASLEGLAGSAVPVLKGVVSAIFDIVLVAVLSIYLLADGSRVTNWLHENMPGAQQGRVTFIMDTLQRVVGGYIRGQLLLCVLIGVLVGVGMQIIGVPYALLLGMLAFLLEFIPVLGTLVSGLICVLLALTVGWITALVVLVYFVVVHLIEGDIVGPRIVGKTIGLHPVVSMAALIAGSELFGITGALFASPVAGVAQALLIAIWMDWRAMHPGQFRHAQQDLNEKVEALTMSEPQDPKATGISVAQNRGSPGEPILKEQDGH